MRRSLLGSFAACLGVALLLLAVPAGGQGLTLTGSTYGAPTFNRPQGDGSAGLSGKMVGYRADTFLLLHATSCVINSAQDYDGYLHLYHYPFDAAFPLVNLIDGDDDGELGPYSSRVPSDLDTNFIDLAPGFYVLVSSGYQEVERGNYQVMVSCRYEQPLQGLLGGGFPGVPPEKQVALNDRFVVAIYGVSNHPSDGIATPVRFGSSDSAFFWFYNASNFEVLVKVLNGCAVNGHWWVFFAATTNQAFTLAVGDLTDGAMYYQRSLGPPSPATTDTAAFDCP